MCPYIKKEYRSSPDYIIGLVSNNELVEALDFLVEYINTVPLEQQDGIINYIFTKLIKNCYMGNLAKNEVFIKSVISKVYLEEPSYFKFERLIGLLKCMVIEFNRRGWNNDFLVMNLLIGYESFLVEYEDKKIEENSDID